VLLVLLLSWLCTLAPKLLLGLSLRSRCPAVLPVLLLSWLCPLAP
jgi:hypothetical protein